MSAATTVNVASAAIPENKTKKVSPSLIAVYVAVSYTHLRAHET